MKSVYVAVGTKWLTAMSKYPWRGTCISCRAPAWPLVHQGYNKHQYKCISLQQFSLGRVKSSCSNSCLQNFSDKCTYPLGQLCRVCACSKTQPLQWRRAGPWEVNPTLAVGMQEETTHWWEGDSLMIKTLRLFILWIFSSKIFSETNEKDLSPCFPDNMHVFNFHVRGVNGVFCLWGCADCNSHLIAFSPHTCDTEDVRATTESWPEDCEEHKLSVAPKKRSEEWKGENSAKIWRFNWRRRRKKGWELENAGVSVQRRGLVSIQLLTSNPFCVCTCCLLPLLHGIPSSVWCAVLFIGITEPRWLSYWPGPQHEKPPELQTIQVPHAPLPFQTPPFIHISALSL